MPLYCDVLSPSALNFLCHRKCVYVHTLACIETQTQLELVLSCTATMRLMPSH